MRTSVTFLLFGCVLCVRAFALDLANPFTSHMVLQRDLPVPIWGTAEPGERVVVKFSDQTKTTTADEAGHWRVDLAPLGPSAEGRTLVVSGSPATVPVELDDIVVGEVWLCSGQSNMDFTVAQTDKYYFAGVQNEAAEVAAADYPLIRMFTGDWTKAYEPQTSLAGRWQICTPDNVREFSAIGYFFARDLQQSLKIPIGIVTLTYGASTAQAWIRREAIEADPRLKPALDEFDRKVKTYVPPTPEQLERMKKLAVAAKKAKSEKNKKKKPAPHADPDPVQNQHNPTVMYNGMIAPVVPFAIRGILWYQGESITPPNELFPLWNETLINDWRKLWHRPSGQKGVAPLPFYFCQLAALRNDSNSPEVRAWQAEALKLPDTGMAVTIDIGDEHSVHPKNKQDVGDRLCRIALAQTYGKPVEYSGPTPTTITSFGAALRLEFSHAVGGLSDHGAPLQTFEVAGTDGKFLPATASIDGTSVYVSSPDVSVPVAVRYAWSDYPEGCNLYNADGLPAAPFQISTGAAPSP